jgi:hypothetical protein
LTDLFPLLFNISFFSTMPVLTHGFVFLSGPSFNNPAAENSVEPSERSFVRCW